MRKSPTAAQSSFDHMAGFHMLRGKVLELTPSGDLLVEADNDGATLFCSFLRTGSAMPPAFCTGDPVLFVAGQDKGRGYVLGIIQPALQERAQEVVNLSATQRIELRCGKSSLTLNRDGSILLRGVDLISRASGVNKIKGAAVKIN